MPPMTADRIPVVAAGIARVLSTVHGREEQIVALAQAAIAGSWTEPEVERGFDAAKAQLKLKGNSTATFAGEIKRACRPRVRTQAGTVAKLARDAWNAEAGAASQPCRKRFKRCYHLINDLFKQIDEYGRTFMTIDEIEEYAIENDPDAQYGKVLRRLKRIRRDWQEFSSDFEIPHSETIDRYFAEVVPRHLKDALEKRRLRQTGTNLRISPNDPEAAG